MHRPQIQKGAKISWQGLFQSMNVVVCIDHSDKKQHRRMSVDRVIAHGSLSSVVVSKLAFEWEETWV